jgi:hypothetical protein
MLMGFLQLNPTIIHGDNEGSVAMVHNPHFYEKVDHQVTLEK